MSFPLTAATNGNVPPLTKRLYALRFADDDYVIIKKMLGADDYLAKPVKLQAVLAALSTMVTPREKALH